MPGGSKFLLSKAKDKLDTGGEFFQMKKFDGVKVFNQSERQIRHMGENFFNEKIRWGTV